MKSIHFFWIAFIFNLYWLLYLFGFLLMDAVIALLLCVATMSIKEGIERYVKFNFIASTLSVLLLLMVFVIPIIYGVNIIVKFSPIFTAENLAGFFVSFKATLTTLRDILVERIPVLEDYAHEMLLSVDNFAQNIDTASIVQLALSVSTKVGKWSVAFLKDTAFVTIFLFIFYYYGKTLYRYTLRLLPLSQQESSGICAEVAGVLGVVVYSLIVSVIFQGSLFGIIVGIFGYDPILFGVLYGFASLVPVVGGTLVWIPLVGYEVYLGNYTTAIIIALYSMIVIATIADNVIKPIIIAFISRVVLKSNIRINEITIFFAIFAGLITFGFWGMVLGPTITAFFVALVRLYENYFLPQQGNH